MIKLIKTLYRAWAFLRLYNKLQEKKERYDQRFGSNKSREITKKTLADLIEQGISCNVPQVSELHKQLYDWEY